jgi:hypothetical protein
VNRYREQPVLEWSEVSSAEPRRECECGLAEEWRMGREDPPRPKGDDGVVACRSPASEQLEDRRDHERSYAGKRDGCPQIPRLWAVNYGFDSRGFG